MADLRKQFQSPPLDLRGAPFWSWNDRLEPLELARQARDMKAHGMGGFFMHSRDGLETEYMGPEWIDCVKKTVALAEKEGMGAWLYDEDRWPSGAAGGLVPARGGDAFRAKILTVEKTTTPPQDDEDVLAVFQVTCDGDTLSAVKRVAASEAAGEGAFLVLRREVSGPSEWFNDDAYADNLNPDAVKAFIDITYEAYADEIGEAFGGAVPGIFTDEPNVFAPTVLSGRRALPWTDDLPAYFEQRRGYSLLSVAPWLFYEGPQATKARHDYWYTISELFTEAFSQQLGEWCEKKGLGFTGHYLCENEMGLAIIRGGAIMPHYRWQHVPGIDMLTEQTHEYLTVKQCSSVSSQYGRKRVLSELYGCSGWEFTFEGQKWNGDWQYVLGVNLRCQHLALYTLRGCRKRDFPPAFNYNTTWWKYNGVVEDYFARVGLLMTQGEAVRDVLLIHPIATGWSMLGEGDESMAAVNAWGEGLNDFAQALLATHYDFDFGDEQLMTTDASAVGDQMQVKNASYRVVVIPPETQTLLPSTVSLLEQYVAAGGQVIAVEPVPTLIGAGEDAEGRLAALLASGGVTVIPNVASLQAALEAATPRRVSVRTKHGQEAASALYMQRAFDGKQAYFIVNNDREHAHRVEIALEGSGRLEEWDPLTGAVKGLPAEEQGGMLRFQAMLGKAGSKLYVVDPAGEPVPGEAKLAALDMRANRRAQLATFIGPSVPFSRTDPNVLTLDMCRYAMGCDCLSDEMEIWRAQSAVRERLGMRQNYYNGLPQRYKWATQEHPNDGTPVELRLRFQVRDVPASPVDLLIESARDFEIALNGQAVDNTPSGWYLDRSFHRVRLPHLREGTNEIALRRAYTNHMELEDCFLLGDFGVTPERVIVAEPDRLHLGDWTMQGYLHYAGSMVYHGQIEFAPEGDEKVLLVLGEYQGVDVAVRVNGALAGHMPWRSVTELELTPYLAPGLNNVDIEVVGSPRNMLGPLHLAPGHEPWTDWRSFRRTDETYTPDYVVQPWGLFGQVWLQRRSV